MPRLSVDACRLCPIQSAAALREGCTWKHTRVLCESFFDAYTPSNRIFLPHSDSLSSNSIEKNSSHLFLLEHSDALLYTCLQNAAVLICIEGIHESPFLTSDLSSSNRVPLAGLTIVLHGEQRKRGELEGQSRGGGREKGIRKFVDIQIKTIAVHTHLADSRAKPHISKNTANDWSNPCMSSISSCKLPLSADARQPMTPFFTTHPHTGAPDAHPCTMDSH